MQQGAKFFDTVIQTLESKGRISISCLIIPQNFLLGQRKWHTHRQYAILPAPAKRRGNKDALPVPSSILSIMKTAITEAKAIVI